MKKTVLLLAALFVVCAWGLAYGQTADGITPAEEEACTKYQGEGARYGLCIAYCEAQDCKNLKDDPSCLRIRDNFITYSKKMGYTSGKIGLGKEVIDCSETRCTYEDYKLCGGKEMDCYDKFTDECTEICSSNFEGYSDDGKPLCTKVLCSKCLKDPAF